MLKTWGGGDLSVQFGWFVLLSDRLDINDYKKKKKK